MPNAWPNRATLLPSRPRPTRPSTAPCRSRPRPTCQPPARTDAVSAARPRESARISAIASSAVAWPDDRVPHTVTPRRSAAATSIEALRMPVVTSRRRFGSRSSSSAGNGVRSRIAPITSNGARRSTSRSASPTWSWKKVSSASAANPVQSAERSATFW